MIEKIPVLLKLPYSHELFGEADSVLSSALRGRKLEFEFRLARLTERDLIGIYPHLPVTILNAQIAQFAHKEIGLWVVTGEGVIETVTRNKGSNNDPLLCEPFTWRFRIADLVGRRSMNLLDTDGVSIVTVHENYVHAPKHDEVPRDMEVLHRFMI